MTTRQVLKYVAVGLVVAIPAFFGGAATMNYLENGQEPPLIFSNGQVRFRASEVLIPAAEPYAIYRATTTWEFENVSKAPLKIQIPKQVAIQGFAGGAGQWNVEQEQADSEPLELSAGEKHSLQFNHTRVFLSQDAGRLTYYQVVVVINGTPHVMGCRSELQYRKE